MRGLKLADSSEDLIIVFLLLAIAFSISFAEPLQKIDKSIQEFPIKLFSFLFNPIFDIFIISIFLFGFIAFTIYRYKNKRYYEKELASGELFLKRESNSESKITEIYIDSDENEDDETEAEFEDEWSSEGEVEDERQEECEPTQTEPKGRNVTIRVDKHKRYFHKKNLRRDGAKYLLEHGYQIKKYKNLLTGRMENFLLWPRFNESFTHLYLVKNISEYLEKKGIETELYITKKPDIVFQIKGKRYAIEVETGSIFSKIERMNEKLEVLKAYDKWFFVVTDRNKVRKYKRYDDAVDKRYVKPRLDNLIKLAEKPQK